MIIDARKLHGNHSIESDICVIGAGVAGVTLARELKGNGLDVCLLESGGMEPDPKTQALCRGESVGHPYYPLETARVRHFGGSSIKWLLEVGNNQLGARLRPLSAIDFEKREWVPHSGWPFDKAHLDPYFDRAQKICKVGANSYEVDDWEDPATTPRLRFAGKRVDTTIYHILPREVYGKDYRKELEDAPDVTVYLHATTLEIETEESGNKVTQLRVACVGGKEFTVKARRFVVAVGGIETPRLLLLSNKTQKTGIGNQHDLVGRFFMEHPHLWSGVFVPSDRGIFKRAGLYKIHMVRGIPIVGQVVINEETIRQERMLNYALVLKAAPHLPGKQHAVSSGRKAVEAAASALMRGNIDEFNRHLSTLFPVVNEFSIRAYRKAMKVVYKVFGARNESVFLLNHMTEQAPNPDSRVKLSSEKDAFGQRRALLDWRLSPIDIRSMVRAQEIIDEDLRRAGLGHLHIELEGEAPPPELHGGWHHMGTTRMHVDPRQGVVDENSRVHGVSNLYVAGPSVFPTGGCANPVLTIVALTVRLADHLKSDMSRS